MDAELFWLDLPNPSKPTLLFLHGLGMGHRMWLPQINALRDDFAILAPDMPGMARSNQAGPFSVVRAAESISKYVLGSRRGPIHVIGLSLGAMVGLQMGVGASPGAFDSLLISGAQVRPPRLLMAVQNSIIRVLPKNRLVRMVSSSIPGNDPEIKTAAQDDAILTGKEGFLAAAGAAGKVDFTDHLAEVGVRTTVACGADDRPNISAAKTLAASIPGATLEIIPGAGHVWNQEMPDEFNRLIRRVVAGLGTSNSD